MNAALIVSVIQALMGFAGQLPSLIKAGETAINLVKDQRDPTPEEQAQIDAGLDDANALLQGT